MNLYDRHKAANHPEVRTSPNGIDIIIECEQCRLAWVMPKRVGDVPVTLYNYMYRRRSLA